jgi:hypothetical protein
MDIEQLKAAGIGVDSYQHHPERRGHISEPVPITVHLRRGELVFECKVYLKAADPRYHYYLQDDDYLRIVAERYQMNVAEYHDITTHTPQNRGKFNQLNLEYRKRTTEYCESFRRRLEAFVRSEQ